MDGGSALPRGDLTRGAGALNVVEVTDWVAGAQVLEAVRTAAAAGDGVDPFDEAIHLRLKHHGLSDARLWLAGDDGFALVHGDDLHLVVAPAARCRGVGTTLATAATGATGARLAWSHGDHPGAAVLADRLGWHRARELWVMRRPTSIDLPPADPEVGIRSFRPGDEAAILAINAAAFAHHPEQGTMSSADLAARMAEPWFDPAGLLIAEVDGEPAGFHWTKQHSPETGEVYVVGIAPAGQGRGLGRALTVTGLRHLAGLGVAEVILYVESDNLAARNLYAGLGFTHAAADTHVQYVRR